MSSVVEWRGSNQNEIDVLLVGTAWVPKYFGRMNAVRLVVTAEDHEDISVGLYDRLEVNSENVLTIHKHKWGRR